VQELKARPGQLLSSRHVVDLFRLVRPYFRIEARDNRCSVHLPLACTSLMSSQLIIGCTSAGITTSDWRLTLTLAGWQIFSTSRESIFTSRTRKLPRSCVYTAAEYHRPSSIQRESQMPRNPPVCAADQRAEEVVGNSSRSR
jgi:hypothetical protein